MIYTLVNGFWVIRRKLVYELRVSAFIRLHSSYTGTQAKAMRVDIDIVVHSLTPLVDH